MTVSVDRRNHPAVQLYLRNGFTEVGRRTVWLAHFS
jgi:ribosomal protein S18 acetylase RimI-like enzyme